MFGLNKNNKKNKINQYSLSYLDKFFYSNKRKQKNFYNNFLLNFSQSNKTKY